MKPIEDAKQLKRLTNIIYYLPHEENHDRPTLGYINGEKYSVAIDAGASPAHINVFYSALSETNLPAPEYTVITHWHWDHTFGMCAAQGKTIAHTNTYPKLLDMRSSGDVFSFGDERMRVEYSDAMEIAIALPDILFESSLALNLGNICCHIIKIPSPHSDDSAAVWIPGEKVLILGDATSPDYFNGGVYDMGELSNMIAWLNECDFTTCVLGHCEPLAKSELMEYLLDLADRIAIDDAEG